MTGASAWRQGFGRAWRWLRPGSQNSRRVSAGRARCSTPGRERLAALGASFVRAGRHRVEAEAHRLERLDAGRRFPAAWSRLAENAAAGLKRAGALLESSSYRRVLERGFALVRDGSGPVVSAAEARKRGRVEIVFADGEAAARIVGEGQEGPARPEQGTLF